MGLKIFTIILVLFIAELTFLATKEPKDLSTNIASGAEANLRFKNLKGESFTKEGKTNKIEALEVIRYKDHEKLYNIKASYNESDIKHTISAKEAIHQDGLVTFKKAVNYENNQSLQIKTENLRYNIYDKTINLDSPFVLQKNNATLIGESLFYRLKDRYMSVEKPKFTQEVDR
ncbi:MAG: LPS export ABC transporter periplasmic protein LptC [Sulfurospirillum sp.]|nr:MAG: LPS export ABC transporter periplasmic protein LptC [Sulfurospirillum sp.]